MIKTTELKELFEESAQTYLFFSKVFFKELTKEAIEELTLADYPQDNGNEKIDQGYQLIRRWLKFKSTDPRTQLACEYARIFLGAGRYTEVRDIAAPYESIFTSEEQLVMQESRDDVYRRFREDGFTVDPQLHEPDDHLSFELEYLASMCTRALDQLEQNDTEALLHTIERQQEFITLHILNWLSDLREAAQKYAQLTFYIGMLLVTEGFAEMNYDFLDDARTAIKNDSEGKSAA